ncbi:winged helix-turn-helix domain-containing protein [Pseudonocardia parietis]|uniref:winged helix-turn-helix domain-containing protein n=1 Tax=Pseudonocardia parietis TaxID=570936 RepID=UPI0035592EEB
MMHILPCNAPQRRRSCDTYPRISPVDVYIRYLRQKIDRPFGVRSVETVRGAGYRLRKDGGRHAPSG